MTRNWSKNKLKSEDLHDIKTCWQFLEDHKSGRNGAIKTHGEDSDYVRKWDAENTIDTLIEATTLKQMKRLLKPYLLDIGDDAERAQVDMNPFIMKHLKSIAEKVESNETTDLDRLKKKLQNLNCKFENQLNVEQLIDYIIIKIRESATECGCGDYILNHDKGRELAANSLIKAVLPKELQEYLIIEINKQNPQFFRELIELMVCETTPVRKLGETDTLVVDPISMLDELTTEAEHNAEDRYTIESLEALPSKLIS